VAGKACNRDAECQTPENTDPTLRGFRGCGYTEKEMKHRVCCTAPRWSKAPCPGLYSVCYPFPVGLSCGDDDKCAPGCGRADRAEGTTETCCAPERPAFHAYPGGSVFPSFCRYEPGWECGEPGAAGWSDECQYGCVYYGADTGRPTV
jgi:hypothetical protein